MTVSNKRITKALIRLRGMHRLVCAFTARKHPKTAEGAWLVAHKAEQRRRFKAILCNKPKTYARIKEERRKAEKQGTTLSEQNEAEEEGEEEEKDVPVLDGFFLMKHCCVEDPSDLCSVNISGKEISEVKEEDLALFDNVAYVNASENFLPFEAFRGFPILRELEMPLNGLRSLHPKLEDYVNLEVLDISYNNLSHEDVLTLGLLQNLKVLHLTGNNFKTLPVNMAMPYYDKDSNQEILRYSKLEILLLDDNKLSDVSVFAALAGLPRLKHLNMEKNEIYYVPMLKSVEGKVVPNDDEKDTKRLRRSAERAGRRSAKGSRSHRQEEKKEEGNGETTVPKPTPVSQSVDTGLTEKTESVTEKDTETKTSDTADTSNGDYLTEDLSSLSRQITEIDLEKEVEKEMRADKQQLGDGSELPPFPDLRLLNLAHNKIEDEEALLAVAAWPMLVELIIHDNPLTTENSGDPPLLQRFLGERLGIKIVRKRDTDSKKPNVEVKMRKSRTVTTVVPKIPKLDVEHLLMLEAPKPPTQPKPEKSRTKSMLEAQKPLPPIPPSPVEGPRIEVKEMSRTKFTEDTKEEPVAGQADDGDAFFMTQVDDQQDERMRNAFPERQRKKKKKERSFEEDKYKGFEVLLDVEDDPNYSPPKDMHGNIKALKYALGHELIYRDPKARLDRISKPVEPYRKREAPSGPPRVTQGQRKETMLVELRDRVTTEEVNLEDVLEGEGKHVRKRFPDADRLLGEIQRRYNTVRVNSMKEAKDAKRLLATTLQESVNKKPDTASRRVKLEA